LASSFEQAIEKQEAWAAASNSSGLVTPSDSPIREAHVVGRSRKTDVVDAVTVPRPLSRSPLHVAAACRVVAIGHLRAGNEVEVTIVPQPARDVRRGPDGSGEER
jgi:hypothetical protein